MGQTTGNPFFDIYKTPFQTPPFDKIKTAHYEPAFDEGIERVRIETDHIAKNPEPATFDNTIVALERGGQFLERVSSVFFNVLNAEADEQLMALSQVVSPKLTESSNNIFLNEQLYARIKKVYDRKETLNLSVEDKMLLDKTITAFRKHGADLSERDKTRYRQLSERLSTLALTFEQNALKDKNRYELILSDEDMLEGLPDSIRSASSLRAKEKGKTGWMFTLSAPSYVPFMRYSANRSLREAMYRAYMSIGNKNDEYDNKEIIKEIVNIRLEIARLMGKETYADYALEHTMAATPSHVYSLLNRLLDAYKPFAQKEYEKVGSFASQARNEKEDNTIMPWDWNYYSEKLKDLRFQVNDEMTKPYFELGNVRKGIFGLATRLYGITFKKNNSIPVYHNEVEAYEVYDADDTFLAVLYTDFHPRDGKQSGAWMNGIKEQYKEADGTDSRPQIIIVMNFSRPTDTRPSLLTYDEVNTFLHEFGHALHGMFSQVTYASLSGTSVYRDFVELPSQIMENWLLEKDFLDTIAVHYETGAPMPEELAQKLVNAANFNVGYQCCRQLSFGFLDMAWHTLKEPFDGNVEAFEKQAWKQANILPEIPGAVMGTNFHHIFPGGYAAGYYGYKWAEVLDADAFALFKERNIFDKQTAASFRENILSKGGTENPSLLYRRFRGSDPTIEALLKKNGIGEN